MKSIRFASYLFLVFAGLAFADPTGRVRGSVKDPDGKPIEKVTITIEARGETPQKFTVTTNAKGEYVQIGIRPDDYRITPSKEGYTQVEYGYVDLHIPPSEKPMQVDFKMKPVQKAAPAGEAPKESAPSPGTEAGRKALELLEAGKYDDAIAQFQTAIAAEPTNAALHYNLGIAFEKKGDRATSSTHYEEAVKLKPDFGEAYLALGNSSMALKNFDKAAEAFSKASELMPQSYPAAYNLGASYSNVGKYAEAEAAYRKAIAISPNEPIVHEQLGMALLGESKNAEAKAEFQKYLELSPNAADKADILDLIKSM